MKNIRRYSHYNNRHKQKQKNQFGRKLVNLVVTLTLWLISAFSFIGGILAKTFKFIFFKPIYFLTRFIFYKGIVRGYAAYLSFLKKIGWRGARGGFLKIIFSQKLVHIAVIILTALLMFINITTKTKAGGLTDLAHKTILADLVQSEFSGFEEDEQLIIESFDREATISNIQQSYLDNLGSLRPQARVNSDDKFNESGGSTSIIQEGATIKPEIAVTTKTKRQREGIIEYSVQSGDSISTIAAAHDISASTILWENDLSAYSIIRPGDKLKILPVSGLSHKIKNGENLSNLAKKYGVKEENLYEVNSLSPEAKLAIGDILVIPGAKKTTYVATEPKTYTGISAIKSLVQAPGVKPAAGNMMNSPTEGKKITQYYSWRHYAIDIANKIGTPIYAADAGTIEYAGWGTGYGNQIVVDHGGGKKTRYAHLSKFYAQKGDEVSKGQSIGEMGSTGWSTGSHLHFEVIINGTKYNPLNYIR